MDAWKGYLIESRSHNEIQLKAIHFKRFHFRKRAILEWKTKYRQRQWTISTTLEADLHYTHTLSRRIWSLWETRLVNNWNESINLKKAAKHYDQTLLVSSLQSLLFNVQENQNYRYQMV